MKTASTPAGMVAIFLLGVVFASTTGAEPTPTPTPGPKGDTSLSDVAGGIKLDKNATGEKGSIVINNQNLDELAGKGRVTEVTKSGPQQGKRVLSDVQGSGAEVEGQGVGYVETLERKQYWQAVYGQQLELIKDLHEQIEILDYDIPGLWRDFYSRDDPAYRDGVIKPKLDEALAKRQKLEVDIQKAEARLQKIKEDSRKDGGTAGWFRGFDKLPTPKPTAGVMPP